MSYIVRIPEPCHEDWNKMTVDEKGRFCNVCSKSVVDFTNKTDVEIHSILIKKSKEKVCGRFNRNQVERPIAASYSPVSASSGFRKVFLAAAFLVFGTFLFSCKDDVGQVMGEPKIDKDLFERLKVIQLLALIETHVDSITDFQLETISTDYAIAGGISYINIPEEIVDTISELSIVDSTDYVVKDFSVLGGAVYFEELDQVELEVVNPIEKELNAIIPTKPLNIFPNPSSGEFTIEYELRKPSEIELNIYDMTGVSIKQVIKPMIQQSGIYRMQFNLSEFPSGIYVCNFIKDKKAESKQIVLVK